MHNLNRKQKELSESEVKRKQLIQQIQEIKQKVCHLTEIQTQIQEISTMMKIQQQKNMRNSSSKEIEAKQKNKNKLHRNSNQKIKMYELKKKLQARNKQYKDQHIIYLSRLRKQEEIVTSITQVQEQIKKQKQMAKQLNRLSNSLSSDMNRIQSKCNQHMGLLTSENQVKKLYHKQKIKKSQQIKKLKRIIKSCDSDTEPDDDIVYSFQQLSNNSRMTNKPFKYELTENNSPQIKCKRENCEEQILIQDYYQVQTPFYVSFKPNQTINEQNYSNLIKPIPIQQSKLNNKSLTQLQDLAYKLEQKVQIDTKKYENLLEGVSLIKRGNKNLQASLKHSMVTLELLKNRVQAAKKSNSEQNRQLLQNISQYQFLYSKLRSKQGERGEVRGKLGIKVENTRILSILNEQINLDLCKIETKKPKLQNMAKQCLDIVKRVLGVQGQPKISKIQ